MQNGGSLQCSISACVTERGERARGAGVDFTGQEAESLLGQRQRERRCTPVLEEGRRQQGKGAVGMESRGVRKGGV